MPIFASIFFVILLFLFLDVSLNCCNLFDSLGGRTEFYRVFFPGFLPIFFRSIPISLPIKRPPVAGATFYFIFFNHYFFLMVVSETAGAPKKTKRRKKNDDENRRKKNNKQPRTPRPTAFISHGRRLSLVLFGSRWFSLVLVGPRWRSLVLSLSLSLYS